jgi:O-Antigen ligase
MTQLWHSPLPSSVRSTQLEDNNTSPLQGIWPRWNNLTTAEKSICAVLILAPLWWFIGWTYLIMLVAGSCITYGVWQGGGLRLQSPSLLVVSVICFELYKNLAAILNSKEVGLSSLIDLVTGICLGFILWYIESKEIHIRTEVIAWAFSVLVVEMLVFWMVAQPMIGAPHFTPLRSLVGQLTEKGERYIPGAGNGNYLIPYWPDDKLPGGLARFAFFFPVPEDFALIAGFITLLALDIKKRIWSLPLFSAGLFLLFLSGTRSNWLVLPVVLTVRFIFVARKIGGAMFLSALIAFVGFFTLSLPLVTELIADIYIDTKEATGNLRKDSTDVRAKIYERTWNAIVDAPEDFILGRGVPGLTVLPGYEPAKVGSHSFILGNLFYRMGLLGTTTFLVFWTSLFLKLYTTRSNRPTSSLLMFLYFSLTFMVMEVSTINYLIILLSVTGDSPKKRLAKEISHA